MTMASLRFESDRGREGWRVRYAIDRKQKSLWLGSLSETDAKVWQTQVGQLVQCLKSGGLRDPATAKWLSSLTDAQKTKLAGAGLLEYAQPEQKSEPIKIEAYLATYFDSHRSDMKPSTWTFYQHTRNRLETHFKGRSVASITSIEAREFRNWLETESNKRDKPSEDGTAKPLASNTVRRRIGVCKRIFAQAVKDGLLTHNPFDGMPSTVRANKARMEYVPLETIELVLAKAPTAQWRALIVLARVAALRIPSEVCGLRWGDIDWDRKRMRVLSRKTEHHEGHESRVIPLFPVVEAELLKLHMEAEDGADRVFPTITMDTNLRTGFRRIIKAAKVDYWAKLWQNLRASGATDMARRLPAHIATAICGHSIEIAQEHYWQVTDSDFDDILSEGKIGGHSSGHIGGHKLATSGNSNQSDDSSQDAFDQGKQGKKKPPAARGNQGQYRENGRGGTRTPDIHGVNVAL